MRLINIRPSRAARLLLAALPFVLLVAAYFAGSAARLADNPNDKLLPALSRHGRRGQAYGVSGRRAHRQLSAAGPIRWRASIACWSALAISTAAVALVIGIVIGLLPMCERACSASVRRRQCRWCRRWRCCRSCSS